eukprot:754782-Hanusia_phi.AAC.1
MGSSPKGPWHLDRYATGNKNQRLAGHAVINRDISWSSASDCTLLRGGQLSASRNQSSSPFTPVVLVAQDSGKSSSSTSSLQLAMHQGVNVSHSNK